jgi:hypothetical protein
MSKSAAVFFILLLVLTSCLIAGCSSPQSPGVPASQEKTGFSSGAANAGIPGKLSLEDAIGYITTEWAGPENAAPVGGPMAKRIRYIHGANLDEQGYAGSWMLVVDAGGKSSMVTISSTGVSVSAAPGITSWTEIDPGRILYPGELVKKNQAVIFNPSQSSTVSSRSLSLEDGNYIITLSGKNGQQTLVFNATTGVLNP